MNRVTQTTDASPATDEEILIVRNLSRRFNQTQALDNISLGIRKGEVFALLGPNGAGKTTLANLLLGTVKADSGEIAYYRRGRVSDSLGPKDIGYFPSDNSIYRSLPLNRMLLHAGTRRGLSEAEAQKTADWWLARLCLEGRAETPMGKLSRGNQQKAQLAEAVLHSPALLFLDEPFTSLDPVNQELFITIIQELQTKGMTILLSDHQLSLVERLANRICILNQGRVVAGGTPEQLRKQMRVGIRVRLRLAAPVTVKELDFLYKNPSIRRVERAVNGEVRILTYEDAVPHEFLNATKSVLRISEIISEPPSLHDLYLHAIQSDSQPQMNA